MLYVEFLFLLLMLYIGSRYGGIGLGGRFGDWFGYRSFRLQDATDLTTNHSDVNHPRGCHLCLDS